MNRQRVIVAAIGASLATVIGFFAVALFVGNFTTHSMETVLLNPASLRGRPTFVISTGALWTAVLTVGAIGGMAIGIFGYLVGREADPDGEQFPLSFLTPIAAVTGAVLAYSMMRAGIGAGGDIASGEITMSVFRMVITVLVSSVTAGAGTALTIHYLVRRSSLGLAGEAWPTSRGAFTAEALRAMAPPMVAAVTIFVIAVGLSQALLAFPGAGAVIIASLVAAVVLGGASVIAMRPWAKKPPQGPDTA